MSLELEQIHEDMLNAIHDRYQKTLGFPAYDFTRAFALAVLSLDGDVEVAERRLNVENLTGQELDLFVFQHRGLSRRYATYATATLRVVTGSGTIQAGALFSTASGVEFYATTDGSYTEGDTFPVRAYLAGESGNVEAGTITYMPVAIAGIAAVTNDAPATGGYDEESDDELRERYYNDLRNPNNGGNQQAYIAWALSVPGVGRVRIFPQALGANTVEVCIVDATMEAADSSLISQVQELIDPNNNGDGAGEAPIGAVATVTTAAEVAISVSATIVLAEEADLGTVTEAVKTNLTEYLREITFAEGTTYVSYAQLSSVVSSTEGVLDQSGLQVNGGSVNIPLTDRQVPVLGEVSLTT